MKYRPRRRVCRVTSQSEVFLSRGVIISRRAVMHAVELLYFDNYLVFVPRATSPRITP